jgi:hypothetical protein
MAALPVAIVGTVRIKEIFADPKSTENVDETIRHLLTRGYVFSTKLQA